MIVKDNEGGDLYMDYKTTIGVLAQGYGPKTHMNITLDEGLLTQRVDGTYNYEGGNLVYTLTYGERSVNEPEYDPGMVKTVDKAEPQTQQKGAEKQDIWLYVGVGAVALIILAAVVLILKKKKTKPETANKD